MKIDKNNSQSSLEIVNKKIDEILENQNIILQQNLFILDYLLGDKKRQKDIKNNLSGIFERIENE